MILNLYSGKVSSEREIENKNEMFYFNWWSSVWGWLFSNEAVLQDIQARIKYLNGKYSFLWITDGSYFVMAVVFIVIINFGY